MISLRNPARTRLENRRLAEGLGVSSVVHVVLFLLWFSAGRPTPATLPDLDVYPPTLTLTEIQLTQGALAFSDIEGPPEAAAGGSSSEGGPAGEAPPSESPDPERPTPPATAPVRSERPDVRREGRPTPAPVPPRPDRPSTAPTSGAARPAPRPTGPNRPVDRQGTGTQSGTGQGVGTGDGRQNGGGTGDGAGSGTGSGSDGTVTREVGFALGNRSFDCPTPTFAGVPGEVTMSITFRPDGGYIGSRGRAGNASQRTAIDAVLRSCRAQRLPPNAAQTNQTGTATFVFRANNTVTVRTGA